jgi:pimeloyl-ACP methyl ester carboxylesterase
VFRAPSTERTVETSDGRVLSVEVTGAAGGVPVFLLHGTPGSRNGPKPRAKQLYLLGIQLITYDRPGYGGSTRWINRRVADAAVDVRAIADELRLDQFSVVGRSGGGPHALACAALLPDRVTRTAVLVGLAPADALGLHWYDGMASENVEEYSTADQDSRTLIERLRLRAERILRNPETLIDQLRSEMHPSDQRIVDDPGIRRKLHATYREAVRHGAAGWIDDVLAFRHSWGFDLETISTPIRLWHGADDTFSPVGHSWWLASQIPGAEMQLQRDAAHFAAMEVLPEILAWLASQPGPVPRTTP